MYVEVVDKKQRATTCYSERKQLELVLQPEPLSQSLAYFHEAEQKQ